MKTRSLSLLAAVLVGFAVGGLAIRSCTYVAQADEPQWMEWRNIREPEVGLSPVFIEMYFTKVKRSIELRFEKDVAIVDGVVFSGSNLESELVKKEG